MRPRGFTLMELLVALTVFSILSVALLGQSTRQLAGASLSNQKMAALSVAENELNRTLADGKLPELGVKAFTVDYLGQNLSVNVARTATEFPFLRRVEVVVSTAGSGRQQTELSRLVGFKGAH